MIGQETDPKEIFLSNEHISIITSNDGNCRFEVILQKVHIFGKSMSFSFWSWGTRICSIFVCCLFGALSWSGIITSSNSPHSLIHNVFRLLRPFKTFGHRRSHYILQVFTNINIQNLQLVEISCWYIIVEYSTTFDLGKLQDL